MKWIKESCSGFRWRGWRTWALPFQKTLWDPICQPLVETLRFPLIPITQPSLSQEDKEALQGSRA